MTCCHLELGALTSSDEIPNTQVGTGRFIASGYICSLMVRTPAPQWHKSALEAPSNGVVSLHLQSPFMTLDP